MWKEIKYLIPLQVRLFLSSLKEKINAGHWKMYFLDGGHIVMVIQPMYYRYRLVSDAFQKMLQGDSSAFGRVATHDIPIVIMTLDQTLRSYQDSDDSTLDVFDEDEEDPQMRLHIESDSTPEIPLFSDKTVQQVFENESPND